MGWWKKVIEIRNAGVNKGPAASELARDLDPDFILAMGDDATDEDVFKSLPPTATSIHVGTPFSNARFNLAEPREVRRLLSELAAA